MPSRAQTYKQVLAGGAAADSYITFLKTIAPTGLVFAGAMTETSGVILMDSSGQGNNADYRAATMLNQSTSPNDTPCPQFVPANNDYVNMPAGFLADFSLDEFCINIWAKVRVVGVWTDATARQVFELNLDGTNRAFCRRTTTNNQLNFTQIAGGTAKVINTTLSTTDWFMVTLNVSKSGNAMKGFINGAQVGTTQTGLGTAAGAIASAYLGAANLVGGSVWDGYEAYCAIWAGAGKLPSDAEVATLYSFLVP